MKPTKPKKKIAATPRPAPTSVASSQSCLADSVASFLHSSVLAASDPPAIAQIRMKALQMMITHVILRQCGRGILSTSRRDYYAAQAEATYPDSPGAVNLSHLLPLQPGLALNLCEAE
jgi:hypothetical protein